MLGPNNPNSKDLVVYSTFKRILFVAAVLAAPAAQAQWTGKAELGALLTDGNSDSKSANTKIDLTHEADKWKHNISAAALYGENAAFATSERYEAQYQANRSLTDRLSWFIGIRGEEDRFSGFAYQATVSSGVTYKFVDSATTKFDGSLGAGYKTFQPQVLIKSPAGEVLDRIKGESDSEPVATLGSNFEHSFTESTKLTNKFLTEYGSSNTSVADDIALQVNMSEVLALAVGLGVRYNSDPPPLAESTDTQLTVNLVYNIK
jgi:putative salt-induced outer membrane protein YdiY